ncbi:hypothetical protein, partial [Limnohabitans sp.]|uniref:hypothetical protein n=1 Tax=Limnohabitans sp. TaxID=1907725 RepID=UPI0037C1AB2D
MAAPAQPATARALRVLFWWLGMPARGWFGFLCHGERGAAILRAKRGNLEIASCLAMTGQAVSGGKACLWWEGLSLVRRLVSGGKACLCDERSDLAVGCLACLCVDCFVSCVIASEARQSCGGSAAILRGKRGNLEIASCLAMTGQQKFDTFFQKRFLPQPSLPINSSTCEGFQ